MAFHVDRWVGAFMAVSGKDADNVFQCLNALAQPVKSMRGVFFGHNAATELEKMLRDSVAASGGATEPPLAVEYAIRFICLLVEKDYFRYINVLLPGIERKLDEQKGVLALSLEAASAVDSGFEAELARIIREKTGAADVKMKTSVKPELLGGYRLRIGGFYIDASLKGQLAEMKADLEAVI
jgi:F0F1-type ATP synthase delta subunit